MTQTEKKRTIETANEQALLASKEIDRYIGSRIQAIRKARNISQKELLYRLHKPLRQQALSRYEKGSSPIPAHLLFDISLALEVTVETFMPLDLVPAPESVFMNKATLKNALDAAIKVFTEYSHAGEKEKGQLEKLLQNLYKN